MRLINAKTFELRDFSDRNVPQYVILSHCWSDEEISLQDYLAGNPPQGTTSRMTSGWRKIRGACLFTRTLGYNWVWVDTCCIDKTSSAELSEAINSMFTWYQRAKMCVVFLSDVVSTLDPSKQAAHIAQSRWFTRGWTLQELIAPEVIFFISLDGKVLGTKAKLATVLAEITGIPVKYLDGSASFRDASVASRLSWAAHRSTTRIEDTAYCLLGLFDVNMPLLYGEGLKAFQRLQSAIISQLDDDTIFAWQDPSRGLGSGMLANSPLEFQGSQHFRPVQFKNRRPPTAFTSRGLEVHSPYQHKLLAGWDKVCEVLFVDPLFPGSQNIRLRLDCEWTSHDGLVYWVGVALEQDGFTGQWYRSDSSRLIFAQQNRLFKRVYPSNTGFKKIYAGPASRPWILSKYQHKLRPYTAQQPQRVKYARSIGVVIATVIAEIHGGLSWIWFVCAAHHTFGLPWPNPILIWGFLTGFWALHDLAVGYIFSVIVLGLRGWNFDQVTYESLNLSSALLRIVPAGIMQTMFDVTFWNDSEAVKFLPWLDGRRTTFD